MHRKKECIVFEDGQGCQSQCVRTCTRRLGVARQENGNVLHLLSKAVTFLKQRRMCFIKVCEVDYCERTHRHPGVVAFALAYVELGSVVKAFLPLVPLAVDLQKMFAGLGFHWEPPNNGVFCFHASHLMNASLALRSVRNDGRGSQTGRLPFRLKRLGDERFAGPTTSYYWTAVYRHTPHFDYDANDCRLFVFRNNEMPSLTFADGEWFWCIATSVTPAEAEHEGRRRADVEHDTGRNVRARIDEDGLADAAYVIPRLRPEEVILPGHFVYVVFAAGQLRCTLRVEKQDIVFGRSVVSGLRFHAHTVANPYGNEGELVVYLGHMYARLGDNCSGLRPGDWVSMSGSGDGLAAPGETERVAQLIGAPLLDDSGDLIAEVFVWIGQGVMDEGLQRVWDECKLQLGRLVIGLEKQVVEVQGLRETICDANNLREATERALHSEMERLHTRVIRVEAHSTERYAMLGDFCSFFSDSLSSTVKRVSEVEVRVESVEQSMDHVKHRLKRIEELTPDAVWDASSVAKVLTECHRIHGEGLNWVEPVFGDDAEIARLTTQSELLKAWQARLCQLLGIDGVPNVVAEVEAEMQLIAGRLKLLNEGAAARRVVDHLKEMYLSPLFDLEDFTSDARYGRPKMASSCFNLGVEEVIEGQLSRKIVFENIWNSEDRKRYVIMGSSGAGKTTLLMRAAYDWSMGKRWNQFFDAIVFLRLSRAKGTSSLVDAILACVFEGDKNWEHDVNAFLSWSRRHRVLWEMDGWDEVTVLPGGALESIMTMETEQVKYVIVGCRPHAALKIADSVLFAMEPLREPEMQERFVHHRLEADACSILLVVTALQKPENSVLRELCKSPLMLTLVCSISTELGTEISSKSDLFGRMITKALARVSIRLGLPFDDEWKGQRKSLCKLAWESFKCGSRVVDAADWRKVDDSYSSHIAICGLLSQPSREWVHMSIQEYLAAEYVCFDMQEDAVASALLGVRSDLFFSFVCGLGGGAFKCLNLWYPKSFGSKSGRGNFFNVAPLLWVQEASDELQTFLVKHWEGITIPDRCALLRGAAENGATKAVQFILKVWGSDNVNDFDNDGFTALHHACRENNESVVRLLIDAGADIKFVAPESGANICSPALIDACFVGNPDIVELVCCKEVINFKSLCGLTALGAACLFNRLRVVNFLAANGANVDDAVFFGPCCLLNNQCSHCLGQVGHAHYPLHIACLNGHGDIVEILLKKLVESGSEGLHRQDYLGRSALHCACQSDALEKEKIRIVKMLIENGSKSHCTDGNGMTPLDYARKLDATTIVELFLEAGRKLERKSSTEFLRHVQASSV